MFKRQFIASVAALSEMPADQVKKVLSAVQVIAADQLASAGEVRVPGIATMKVVTRTERAARNPKTGTPHLVQPGHTVKVRPVTMLTDAVVSRLAARQVQF